MTRCGHLILSQRRCSQCLDQDRSPEYRRKIVALVRAGRKPHELANEFECSAQTIRNWVAQTDGDEGKREEVLNSIVVKRSGSCAGGEVLHHSDQGTQYTSIAFGMRCRETNVRPSMGSVGDCFDNAMAESFSATLACDLPERRRFKTQAKITVFDFIEGWYKQ